MKRRTHRRTHHRGVLAVALLVGLGWTGLTTGTAEAASKLAFTVKNAGGQTGGSVTIPLSGTSTVTKLVALTFDDGPSGDTTQTGSGAPETASILAELKAAGAHATFFDLGDQLATSNGVAQAGYDGTPLAGYGTVRTPDSQAARDLVAAGMVIGSHTYDHYSATGLSAQPSLTASEFQQEVTDTFGAFTTAGLPQPTLFRYPYGDSNATDDTYLASRGLIPVYWQVVSGDAGVTHYPYTAADITNMVSTVVNQAVDGGIILMHDNHTKGLTDVALPQILAQLKTKGFGFGKIALGPGAVGLNESPGGQAAKVHVVPWS